MFTRVKGGFLHVYRRWRQRGLALLLCAPRIGRAFGSRVQWHGAARRCVVRGVALMVTCKRSLERYWARKSEFEEGREQE